MRIIFMGTPEFAVPSLKILVENDYEIVAVITAPDKPKGRGRKLLPSPVKETALEYDIPVLQPKNLKDQNFIDQLRSYKADLQVVVAFRMLPEVVWNMPAQGTFNLHASWLPFYRGAAPIHWAVINGETETGVSTFFLKHAIDTGNIILQEREPISLDDTTGTLYQRLMEKGSKLVLKTVQLIEAGNYELLPQDLSLDLPKAPKIFKDDAKIDWQQDSRVVYNLVRGMNPFPVAWTEINHTLYKVYKIRELDHDISEQPGDYKTDHQTYLHVQTNTHAVAIDELQAPGKRRMNIEDFLRGNR